MASREFLEECWAAAKKQLPGWAYAGLMQAARAKAGGRARHRVDEPDIFAKIALTEIKPSKLEKIDDKELRAIWLRLHQWYANAKGRKAAVENIVNAGLWVSEEMKRRGNRPGEGALVDAIEEIASLKKERRESVSGKPGKLPKFLGERLKNVPEEVLLVRDFVCVAGSAAVAEKPNDIDVVVRAEYDAKKGKYELDGSGLWVALRRFLTPGKSGPQMQLLSSPAGSFTDYAPVFDLVARKREPRVEKIEPDPPEYEGQGRVVKADDAFKPPETVAEAAMLGLVLREKFDRGGTEVGVARARDLSNRRNVSADTVQRMRSFFARHGAQVNRQHPQWENKNNPSAQWIAWLLWGGDPGRKWAEGLKIEKQARAASLEIKAQADKAKREDKLTLGEFFYQPKPTRPAFAEEAQTVDRLIELYEQRTEKWLPAWVQKKYDGANHQIHKDLNEVKIISEDGDDNTDRLPSIVKAVQELPVHRGVFAAEIEWWEDEQHLPREKVAGYLAEKSEPDDSKLVANIYDVMSWKGEDVHKKPLKLRLEYLRQLGKGTMQIPKQPINIAPGELVETPSELRKATEKIRKLPGSEGIVAKQFDSIYPLDFATSDRWVKYHNATTIKAQVLKAHRTKGGVWTYAYGVRPGKDDPAVLVGELVPVGESFSTARKLRPGDAILIEAESVNKIISSDGVKVTAWVPRVLGEYAEEMDTVDSMIARAAENLVLQVKRADDKGEVIEYYPANVIKALRPEVPVFGPKNAKIGFVGASPGRMEAARKEPFVGPGGETFNDVYLKPLGLKRSDVSLFNAVPLLLTDERGRTREPTIEEIKEWSEWLTEQLDEYKPKVVVALGRTAEGALGKRCDFTLPHPSAVRRFGDSGEVGRKLKQIKERIEVKKQLPKPLLKPRSEGGTRAVAAFDTWEKSWHEMLPSSGKGRFVYQHHWRGLTEEEIDDSDDKLMESKHSVHGDIRLEADKALWGWAVFLGRTEDNKDRELNDKLIDWKEGNNLELAPKLAQPKEWLDVGVKKPLITPPGAVGATSEKYSKFFGLDHGTYELGVARKHMVEIFLDGEHFSGRYLYTYAPVAGRRRWLIDKPEDQTPYADRRDLADTLSELRKKGQRFLIWAKPGERPKKYDVRTGREVKRSQIPISKADPVKQIVYGVVLDPYGNSGQPDFDAHNDWTPPAEVEKTAHGFLKGSRVIGLQHKKKAKADVVESWIESYPSRKEYLAAVRGLDHRIYRRKFGDDVLHSGAWVLGVQLGDREWKMYQDGKLNAFSPGGFGVRQPIKRSDMPKVEIIELVEKPQRKSA